MADPTTDPFAGMQPDIPIDEFMKGDPFAGMEADIPSEEELKQQAALREDAKSVPSKIVDTMDDMAGAGRDAILGLPQTLAKGLNPHTYIDYGRGLAQMEPVDALRDLASKAGQFSAEGAAGLLASPMPALVPSAMATAGTAYDTLNKTLSTGELPDTDEIRKDWAQRMGAYNTLGAIHAGGRALTSIGRQSIGFSMGEFKGPKAEIKTWVQNFPDGGKDLVSNVGKAFDTIREDGALYGIPSAKKVLIRMDARIGDLYSELEPLMSELDKAHSAGTPFKVKLNYATKLLSPANSRATKLGNLQDALKSEMDAIYNTTGMQPSAVLDQKRAMYKDINWDDPAASSSNAMAHALALDIKDSLEAYANKVLTPEQATKFDRIHKKLGAYFEMQPIIKNEYLSQKRWGDVSQGMRMIRTFGGTAGGALLGQQIGGHAGLGALIGGAGQVLLSPAGGMIGGKILEGAGDITQRMSGIPATALAGLGVNKLPSSTNILHMDPSAIGEAIPPADAQKLQEAKRLPEDLQIQAVADVVRNNRDQFSLPDNGPQANLVVVNNKIPDVMERQIYTNKLLEMFDMKKLTSNQLAQHRNALNKDGTLLPFEPIRLATPVTPEENVSTVDVGEDSSRLGFDY